MGAALLVAVEALSINERVVVLGEGERLGQGLNLASGQLPLLLSRSFEAVLKEDAEIGFFQGSLRTSSLRSVVTTAVVAEFAAGDMFCGRSRPIEKDLEENSLGRSHATVNAQMPPLLMPATARPAASLRSFTVAAFSVAGRSSSRSEPGVLIRRSVSYSKLRLDRGFPCGTDGGPPGTRGGFSRNTGLHEHAGSVTGTSPSSRSGCQAHGGDEILVAAAILEKHHHGGGGFAVVLGRGHRIHQSARGSFEDFSSGTWACWVSLPLGTSEETRLSGCSV